METKKTLNEKIRITEDSLKSFINRVLDIFEQDTGHQVTSIEIILEKDCIERIKRAVQKVNIKTKLGYWESIKGYIGKLRTE